MQNAARRGRSLTRGGQLLTRTGRCRAGRDGRGAGGLPAGPRLRGGAVMASARRSAGGTRGGGAGFWRLRRRGWVACEIREREARRGTARPPVATLRDRLRILRG